MLVQLLYASRPIESFTPSQMESILEQSRRNNHQLGITGLLCHSGNAFLQVLEGGRGAVNDIYNRIVRDDRHQAVELLHYAEISERSFPNWTMGHVNLAKVNPAIILRYCETVTLDPYRVSGKACMALLQELIASAAIVSRS